MYSDAEKKKRPWLLPVVILVVIVAAAALFMLKDSGRDLSDESVAAIRQAVERSALQCYVVEGIYPPSLSYLEENYGLQVNTEDFYVTYDAFASNLPPTVKVVSKR